MNQRQAEHLSHLINNSLTSCNVIGVSINHRDFSLTVQHEDEDTYFVINSPKEWNDYVMSKLHNS